MENVFISGQAIFRLNNLKRWDFAWLKLDVIPLHQLAICFTGLLPDKSSFLPR
jgi:hypothetical protein